MDFFRFMLQLVLVSHVSYFGRNKNVRFGVCLPQGATFDLYTYAPRYLPTLSRWIEATSLSDLDSTLDGTKYFHDKTTGYI